MLKVYWIIVKYVSKHTDNEGESGTAMLSGRDTRVKAEGGANV